MKEPSSSLGTNSAPKRRKPTNVAFGGPDGRTVYVTLQDRSAVNYLVSTPYAPSAEGGVRWDDPAIGIDWPVAEPLLSPKDAVAPLLADIPLDRLPVYEGA